MTPSHGMHNDLKYPSFFVLKTKPSSTLIKYNKFPWNSHSLV